MSSIWEKTVQFPSYEQLSGDRQTDVLIIGGGITGLLCAATLKQAGVDCVILEAVGICRGITKNTTAKITAQHGLIYNKLIRQFGVEKAAQYLAANLDALEQYRRLAETIDCDFETKDSYVYTRSNPKKLEKEAAALQKLSFSAPMTDDLNLPISVAGAICFQNQAQFHPLKFAMGIAKDVTIFEHTPVRRLQGTTALTDRGCVHAQKVIIATHFPSLNLKGLYFLKQYQHRSYVLVLKGAPSPDGMYIDEDSKGLSFRTYGQYCLLGGGGHRTGCQGGGYQILRDAAARYLPTAQVVGQFATQDCMTLDGVPYIGPYTAHNDRIFVATGYNKWGMTSSMVAAVLLRDAVLGHKNPYAPVFCPNRSIWRPQLAINVASATAHLLSPATPRCPHMGCRLSWNTEEHTWDCPCHGSRFTESGQLIDNPSKRNL